MGLAYSVCSQTFLWHRVSQCIQILWAAESTGMYVVGFFYPSTGTGSVHPYLWCQSFLACGNTGRLVGR